MHGGEEAGGARLTPPATEGNRIGSLRALGPWLLALAEERLGSSAQSFNQPTPLWCMNEKISVACHPERSSGVAKRNRCAVEGPRVYVQHHGRVEEFLSMRQPRRRLLRRELLSNFVEADARTRSFDSAGTALRTLPASLRMTAVRGPRIRRHTPNCLRWWSRCLYMPRLQSCAVRAPKKGWGCFVHCASPPA